ncbi:hypothetical protein X975_07413, partial [Stegodyphus mimosarum]
LTCNNIIINHSKIKEKVAECFSLSRISWRIKLNYNFLNTHKQN